jgi:hypothetical protein
MRSSRRTPTEATSGFLWAYEDPARGIALIRGRGVSEALDLAGVSTARWSAAGKGHVVPIAVIADVAAACDHLGIVFRQKPVRP